MFPSCLQSFLPLFPSRFLFHSSSVFMPLFFGIHVISQAGRSCLSSFHAHPFFPSFSPSSSLSPFDPLPLSHSSLLHLFPIFSTSLSLSLHDLFSFLSLYSRFLLSSLSSSFSTSSISFLFASSNPRSSIHPHFSSPFHYPTVPSIFLYLSFSSSLPSLLSRFFLKHSSRYPLSFSSLSIF